MFPWITAHFVNPAMLAGGALIAAPILIWLFSRLRFRTVEWAAQSFLLRALKRSQRRLRVENLLLLLIRCAVILLFVLALARPRGQPIVLADTTDARRNVVILLDTSYSTGYQVGSDTSQTVHEREKRAAKDLIRQLRPVDRLSVIAFDETARKVYATPRTVDAKTQREVLEELETLPEVQRSARSTDYASAFHLLPEVLRRFDAGPDGLPPPPDAPPSLKSVFLLTDMQRNGLLQGPNLRDPSLKGLADDLKKLGATVFVVDCGADDPKNAGVVSLETREPIVGVNLPCYIDCTVRNWGTVAPGARSATGKGGEAMAGLTLEYFVDGSDTPVKAVSLDLLPEESKQLEPLRYVFHDEGPHRIVARLRSDALQLDNERALVVDVRQAVRVLLVDGEPSTEKWASETDFLRTALDPFGDAAKGKDLIRPDVIQEPALPAGNLRGSYDLIVFANVVSIPDDHVVALEQFVREGGNVVFTLGGLVDKEHYNAKLWRNGAGLFPCKLGEVRGPQLSERTGDRDPNAPEWVFGVSDSEHSVARIFVEEDMKGYLKMPSVFRFFEAADLRTQPDKGPRGVANVALELFPRPRTAETDGRPGGEGSTPKDAAAAQRDGAPVYVEKSFGRGKVGAYLTTVDAAWNNAVMYDGFYLVFWRQLTLELAKSARPRRNIAVGERYERVLGATEFAPTVEVTDQSGNKETFRPEPIEGREQYRVSFPPSAESRTEKADASRREEVAGCERPGIYEVRLTGAAGEGVAPPADYFAVRLDPSEGDVTKLDLEDWEQLFGHDVKRASPDALMEAFQGPGQGPQGNELWPHAIAACVSLLAIESLLAALFGRRRQ